MARLTYRFGHRTAGEEDCKVKNRNLVEVVNGQLAELHDSVPDHEHVYFVNGAGEVLTVFQSGLLKYADTLSATQTVYYLPDSRDTLHEMVLDFLGGNKQWWIDKFRPAWELPSGQPALFAASRKGTVDYPLHRAALDGDLADVKGLLLAGSNVNSLDNKRRTPLVLATTQGHLEVCQYLIEHGANIHVKDDWGNSLLALAHEHPRLLQYFKSLPR